MRITKLLSILFLCCYSFSYAQNYKNEIAAFQKADSLALPPTGANLFVGASSFRLWKSLAADFPKSSVINRGFGGAHLADVNYYFDLLVPKYKPAKLFVYAGENDIAAGASAEQVYERFLALAQKIQAYEPTLAWVYLSLKPSVLRRAQFAEQSKANTLIKTKIKEIPQAKFVDIVKPMLKKGKVRPDLFVADSLHMNSKGYKIWQKKLKKHLI